MNKAIWLATTKSIIVAAGSLKGHVFMTQMRKSRYLQRVRDRLGQIKTPSTTQFCIGTYKLPTRCSYAYICRNLGSSVFQVSIPLVFRRNQRFHSACLVITLFW